MLQNLASLNKSQTYSPLRSKTPTPTVKMPESISTVNISHVSLIPRSNILIFTAYHDGWTEEFTGTNSWRIEAKEWPRGQIVTFRNISDTAVNKVTYQFRFAPFILGLFWKKSLLSKNWCGYFLGNFCTIWALNISPSRHTVPIRMKTSKIKNETYLSIISFQMVK